MRATTGVKLFHSPPRIRGILSMVFCFEYVFPGTRFLEGFLNRLTIFVPVRHGFLGFHLVLLLVWVTELRYGSVFIRIDPMSVRRENGGVT